MLAAALAYAAREWRVFPCRPRRKEPIVVHGFKDSTVDLEQIRAWWRAYPNANIATPTGERFDVVDFDHVDLYHQARDLHDLEGPIVRTARGAHFYVAPTGRRTTKLTASIDFKAAGGYVLLPPSVHPSGAVYTWITRGEPHPAPEWLRRMLSARREISAPPARAYNVSDHMTPRGVASLRAMADRLAAMSEGNRNAFLFWAAVHASDTGASCDNVAIVLRDAAQRAGLGGREIEDTLTSAFKRWT